MQCTWPPLARLAFRGFARPSSTNRTAIHNHLATHSAPWLSSPEHVFSFSALLQQRRLYASVQTSRDTPSSTTPPPSSNAVSSSGPLLDNTTDSFPSENLSKPSYSHTEIGRNAAQAVRVSVQQGNLRDGYLIVQSLYHSRLASDSQNKKARLSAVRSLSFLGKPDGDLIEFDKRVSPRLSAHALLHSLIRRGESQKAEQLAYGMMSIGTRVRYRSLEAVLEGLADRSSSSPPTLFKPLIPLNSHGVTILKPHMATNADLTGGALRILQAARQSGGGSTKRMYRYLITLCIINGEIILASLIFGVLLRDWQAREKAKEAAAAAAKSLLEPLSFPTGLPESINEVPVPEVRDLRRICTFITWNFRTPMTDASSKLAFSASLQALANLAHDMDKGRLCVSFEPVITAMSKCPRTHETVWISEGERLKNVQAYAYFHEVLDRLITSLPDRDREQEQQRQEAEINKGQTLRPVEPVNPFTYNALLHYTLRHVHSLNRAEFVLTHLVLGLNNAQPPQLAKTAKVSALNILERAKKDYPPGAVESLMNGVGLGPTSFDELVSAPEHELDPYALGTRIDLMVSMGQSNAVVEALPKLLPGLFPPASPHGTHRIVAMKAAEKWREDGLSKAVRLGPVVFGALLNALRKDGRTGLAESVFLYGLEAEKKSFETDVSYQDMMVVIRPWCLPQHAYTTMTQIYNNERLQAHTKNPDVVGWGLTPEGIPLRHIMKDGELVNPVKRNVLARRMIVQMYRSLMAAPEALARRLAKLEALVEARRQGEIDGSMKGKPNLKIDLGRGTHGYAPPEADIWFFESLLDMFMKTPEDPLLPALVREMHKMGMGVRQNVTDVVRNTWGTVVLDGFAVEGTNVKERKRDPLGQRRDKRPQWKKEKVSVPSRMGWKRWTVVEQRRGSIRRGTVWMAEDIEEARNEVTNALITAAPA